MGIQVCTNQEDGPLWGLERGYNSGNFGYLRNIPVTCTNHWPVCIAIWYQASLGQGDSNLRK